MLLEVRGWIPRLVERQFENLEGLCAHRERAHRSHDWTPRTVARLEQRIDAYVDALVLAGSLADDLFAVELGSGRPHADLAAGIVLLSSREAGRAHLLWSSLQAAQPADRAGMALALFRGPVEPLLEDLTHADEDVEAIAALAGRLHAAAGPPAKRIRDWRLGPDPLVRAAGWLLTGLDPFPFSFEPDFMAALDDPEPNVREAACWAAFVSGQPWFREHCLARFAHDAVVMRWFVVLTTSDDVEAWRDCAQSESLGPERFIALGGTGLLELGTVLLEAMEGPPAEAVAANIGYRRLTGADFQSSERRPLDPTGDEFDLERQVYIPDAEAARAHYDGLREARSPLQPAEDNRSRWETRARTTRNPSPLLSWSIHE